MQHIRRHIISGCTIRETIFTLSSKYSQLCYNATHMYLKNTGYAKLHSKTSKAYGKNRVKTQKLSVTHNKKKEESVKNSSNFTHVKWLKIHKYYNKYDTLPGKTLDACGSGHQKDYSL